VNLARVSCLGVMLAAFGTSCLPCLGQRQPNVTPPVPGPMLADGILTRETPEFRLSLVKSSQTIADLKPKSEQGFDFAPSDQLVARSQNGFYHLGDLDLRLRNVQDEEWKGYSTAAARKPVRALPAEGNVLARADLAPTFAPDIPLEVTRTWSVEGGKLILRFTLKNKTGGSVEIGALGIPMVFNNIISGRNLQQAHEICSFFDPYIGADAGYLQVTRLNGHGPVLLVVPDGKTPFEAYNPIVNPQRPRPSDGPPTGQEIPVAERTPATPQLFTDLTPRGMTFEGFYDWMVASKAYQENDWKAATPWNQPTSITLKPGESRTVGLQFLLAPQIRDIEKTLAANRRPVAVGIPGYILPKDIDGRLFLEYPEKVASITVEPAGAIEWKEISQSEQARLGSKTDRQEFVLHGKKWGQARVSITYADGTLQTISYRVIKPEAEAVADMGHFLSTNQWFVDAKDPFHRSPSPMSYDREENRIITQDSRVWVAGLSDEGGAGPYLAMAMKELGEPDAAEVKKYEGFIDDVLWGQIQVAGGPQQYGVKKSIFYYEPSKFPAGYYDPKLNWKSWTSWSEKDASQLSRSFNYPHVVAAYWAMYRLARNHTGLVTNHDWKWYLDHAYETCMAMGKFAPYYTQYGQMEGDVFLSVLEDLQREGLTTEAHYLEQVLRQRADHWKNEPYPFGSEMPWDSTGQEEVYALTKYFGDTANSQQTVSAILGYDPTIPSWGYNGSARRFWDFLYGGKYSRLERQLHHYGSGINATPLLSQFRDEPQDLYLLRVGYGGTMGELSNIDQDGFASAAFHAFPDKLAFDPLTGDYGSGFFGHAINTGTYLVNDPEFGWISFGGNVAKNRGVVTVTTLDSFRNRLYMAPLGLWLTLDAGSFVRAEFNPTTGTVRLTLSAATPFTTSARLRIEQPGKIAGLGQYAPTGALQQERGAYVIPLKGASTTLTLRAESSTKN
jgi:hypothetical protein